MLEDTRSHFVMIFQSHRGMYQLDNDRTYALVLDRGYPEWLNIDFFSNMLRDNYEINFYLALLIQIEVDYDDNPFTQFSQIRRFFLNNFKKNLVSIDKEGVWSLPEDEIKKAICTYASVARLCRSSAGLAGSQRFISMQRLPACR